MLNKRCLGIIKYMIDNNKSVSLKEISNIFDVSERSIRYDIDNINYFLAKNGLNQIEKMSKGLFKINETDENLYKIIEILNTRFYTFSKHERKEYIKSLALFSIDAIRLHEISETLSVSISTIKLDLKEVKIFLNESKLKLKFLSKIGLVLKGNEEKIRKAQLKFLMEYLDISKDTLISKIRKDETLGYKLIRNELKLYFENFPIRDVRIFIKRIERELQTVISDEAYRVLQFYLMIALTRLKEGKTIVSREENEKFLKSTKEYNVLIKELVHFEQNFNVEFNEYEILFLTELFLGSHSYNFNTSFYENWIEIEISINEIIKDVGKALGIDLSNDKILFDGLLNHLKPAIYRIKNDIVLENEISNEVKELYDELFDIVKKVCEDKLQIYINKQVPDEEIAFLTIHFKTAIDRKANNQKETKNVMIVCGFGYGSSKLLAQKLLERYDVNVLDTLPYHKFLEIENYNDIDLIISTLDVDDKIGYPFPIVKVNPIFSKTDRKKLEEYGLTEVRKKISLVKLMEVIKGECEIENEAVLADKLKTFLRGKLFDDRDKLGKKNLNMLLPIKNIKLDCKADNWEDAIRQAGKILVKNGSIKPGYIDEMIEAVNKNGSYMVVAGKIALPHARLTNSVLKTDMSLIKLKEVVDFPENKKVKMILAFSSVDQNEHIEALTELVTLVEDYEFIEFIEEIDDPVEIKKFITEKS
ncbi:BglG family transcriptional antiterminator [Hypnocyclicus thermotrophus]|uniref:BglG family transcriptional antiterminator n=1 Tax=Hypnocyclicus thermotrophus TaxID=1627895 RepID=A0AA46DWZ0_9FUSO|nr:BglG family transcription antiterminator [Hypnocyclicus thermotrophus]TDT66990.1 BglG family transcriptional antiterminator [Hypnocyclicus thermotrophus]